MTDNPRNAITNIDHRGGVSDSLHQDRYRVLGRLHQIMSFSLCMELIDIRYLSSSYQAPNQTSFDHAFFPYRFIHSSAISIKLLNTPSLSQATKMSEIRLLNSLSQHFVISAKEDFRPTIKTCLPILISSIMMNQSFLMMMYVVILIHPRL